MEHLKIFTGPEMLKKISEAEWEAEERVVELVALMREEKYERID
mgnify:CR=1 FL=1